VKICVRWALISSACLWHDAPARSQSLGNAGTIAGSVADQSGAAIARAEVHIHKAITGDSQSVLSGPDGGIQLVNIQPRHTIPSAEGCRRSRWVGLLSVQK
jgi:hypothetical protein